MATSATTTGMMHIGELAEKSGHSLRTIRHYDEVGLLKPSGRTEGGFRLYTQADLDRLLLIHKMKPLAFSLEEMTEILAEIERMRSGTGNRERFSELLEQAEQRRSKLHEQARRADAFVELLRGL